MYEPYLIQFFLGTSILRIPYINTVQVRLNHNYPNLGSLKSVNAHSGKLVPKYTRGPLAVDPPLTYSKLLGEPIYKEVQRNVWYFVIKIVLTYCEKKLFQCSRKNF